MKFLTVATLVTLFGVSVSSVFAASISNVQITSAQVPQFEKYEIKFSVQTSSQFPFFEYTNTVPAGVTPNVGITTEANITAPSGKQYTHPAFFMEDFKKSGSAYDLTGNAFWSLRFSPQEVGSYKVRLKSTDASGTSYYPPIDQPELTFTSSSGTKPGFIKVSSKDTRYFEYSNGKIFWPLGPTWFDNIKDSANPNAKDFDYTQYIGTGLNLDRPWMQGLTQIYSGNWATWQSSAEETGNEGFAQRLEFRNVKPGSDLSYPLFFNPGNVDADPSPNDAKSAAEYRSRENGFKMTIAEDDFTSRPKPSTCYQYKVVYKSQNLSGPRKSGQPWGFTAKAGGFVSNNESANTSDDMLRNATVIMPHITSNQNWATLTGTYRSASASPNYRYYIYLDNVTSGQVYIDEFSLKEITSPATTSGACPTTNIALGGEIIRHPKASIDTYFDQKGAAFVDNQVTEAEKGGVALKYVIHDKNDPMITNLRSDGTYIVNWGDTDGGGYFQPESTKARWLLRQWYRYLVARWGYSTSIFAWEMMNEGPPEPVANGTSPHWEMAESFAKYIRSIDAHPHMASTSNWCCWRPAFWGNNTLFPDISFGDLHEYSANAETTGNYFEDIAGMMEILNNKITSQPINKPFLLSETGLSDPSSDYGDSQNAILQNPNPGIWYRHYLWSGLNTGAPFAPGYWFFTHTRQINREAIATVFYNFIKDADFNLGGYTALSPTTTNSQIRFIGQKNASKGKAYIWVQNKAYNFTKTNPTAQSANATINSFTPNTAYTLTRVNTATGSTTQESITSNSSGQITFAVSNLVTDQGIKIAQTSAGTTPVPTNIPPTQAPTPVISTPTKTPSQPTATPTPKPTDLNGDGQTTNADATIILSAWKGTYNANYDINSDKIINLVDYAYVAQNILSPIGGGPINTQTPPTATAVPPSSTPTTPRIPPGTTTTPAPQTTSGDWPQLQRDAQHTGRSPIGLQGTDNAPYFSVPWIWLDSTTTIKNFVSATNKSVTDSVGGASFTKKNQVAATIQPIAVNNRVYFGTLEGQLVAVDGTTGNTVWTFATGGPILATPAYANGIIVTGSMDSKVYGIKTDGTQAWVHQLGGGVSASITIYDNTAYIGSRDGKLYAIDITTGNQKWVFASSDPDSKFANAAIMAPPAVSEDGNMVIYGAENMRMYGVNASNGQGVWNKKVIGQSFEYSWPVIKSGKVFIYTASSLYGTEEGYTPFEDALSGAAANNLSAERSAIQGVLNTYPNQKSLTVINIADGSEPYQVAMGRVSGNGYPPFPPVIANTFTDSEGATRTDPLITYWRSRSSTLLGVATFGTKYCPDLSELDIATGFRVTIPRSYKDVPYCPEIDNGFALSVGGKYLYMHNHFRGTDLIDLSIGRKINITAPLAVNDCGKFRGDNSGGWISAPIIYYGNDNASDNCGLYDPTISSNLGNTGGFVPVSIATLNGKPTILVNESDAFLISAITNP